MTRIGAVEMSDRLSNAIDEACWHSVFFSFGAGV
jgi:hypothetical protein